MTDSQIKEESQVWLVLERSDGSIVSVHASKRGAEEMAARDPRWTARSWPVYL